MRKQIPLILRGSLYFMLAVGGLTCSSPNDDDLPLQSPGLSSPLVTGLWITSSESPDPIAIWGHPSDPPQPSQRYPGQGFPPGGNIPTTYSFVYPFPNPFNVTTTLDFALPEQTIVSIWIVPARSISDPNTDVSSISGGSVITPTRVAIREMLRDSSLYAGYYSMQWDGNDDRGAPTPGGFYRAYFEAGGYLLWHDILLVRSIYDLPPALRELLFPGQ